FRAVLFLITLFSSSHVIQKAKEKILHSSKDLVNLKLNLHLKFEKNEARIEEIKDKFMKIHNNYIIDLLYNNLLFYSEEVDIPLRRDTFDKFVINGTIIDIIMNPKIKKKHRKILLYYYSLYDNDTKFNNIYIDFKAGKYIKGTDESLN